MSYIGAKPAEQILSSADIQDGSIATADLADASITQAKLASGVAGSGPAFSVYRSGGQTISNASYTKIQFNTEVFDTASCFDTSTNRFTPNVAGYYQINLNTEDATGFTSGYQYAVIYKNGSIYARTLSTNSLYGLSTACSTIVYCNGLTDYIEGYYFQASGANSTLSVNQLETFMTGCMIRSA